MSQIYVNEPATEGKVVITTTHGELEVELFSREAPMACKSFVQHCLNGYYDDCAFTRCVENFVIQTGDPSNTGRGGTSALGDGKETFADEFHSRLRFNTRGRVAMANAGRRDTNGSQFFVTLEACEWLNKKHTIFGKLVGATMYNAMEIGKCETDGDDRPIDPAPRVVRTEVLMNPFPEITRAVRVASAEDVENAEDFRRKKKPKKKLALLSFGEEAADEEQALEKAPRGILSSHDVGGDDTLVSADAEETREALKRTAIEKAAARERKKETKEGADGRDGRGGGSWDADENDANADAASFQDRMREKMLAKRREMGDVDGGTREIERDAKERADKREMKEQRRREKEARAEERKRREVTKLKKLGLGKRAVRDEEAALLTSGQVQRLEARARKSRTQDREKETLERLAAFNAALKGPAKESGNEPSAASAADEETGRAGVSRFVPQGLYYMDDDADDDDDANDWRSHKLAFVPEAKRNDAGAYMASVDDYEVIDPLSVYGKAVAEAKEKKRAADASKSKR